MKCDLRKNERKFVFKNLKNGIDMSQNLNYSKFH